MSRKTITTSNAPQAIGPYSQAIQCGSFLFVSGQIALDPETGQLVNGDAASQTRQIMENIKGVVEAAGMSLKNIVKCTIYLKNMGDFTTVNDIYGRYFNVEPPARATVEVSALPKNVTVEIDAIAYRE